MAERQKRQQQIAPADAAAANGSERRSPLPGDRGDRGSKVTNSPQPARRPPSRLMGAQPAGPALPGRQRQAPRTGECGSARGGARAAPASAKAAPGPLFPPPPYRLLRFCWGFSFPNRKAEGPARRGAVTGVAWLPPRQPSGHGAQSLPLPLRALTPGCRFPGWGKGTQRNQAFIPCPLLLLLSGATFSPSPLHQGPGPNHTHRETETETEN